MEVRYWLADAIYGINDGLAAIFGIVAGVAGYSQNHRLILLAGMFGVLASALSMGAGAWLAARSKNEMMGREIARLYLEHEQFPRRPVEKLVSRYVNLGFNGDESRFISERIAANSERLMRVLLVEESGFDIDHPSRPLQSALFGSVSTLIGGLIPLIPLFIWSGQIGFWLAAIGSIVAHFVVGAVKSVVTLRSWWASGSEMMLIGLGVGIIAYGLGMLGGQVF